VSSDSKPSISGVKLFVCEHCGFVEKEQSEEWLCEVERVYREYTIYHQAQGAEQLVYTKDAHARSRSTRLVDCMRASAEIPARGRLLDVGCGNGGFLRGFCQSFPQWELFGSELSRKYEAEIRAIAGVKDFYSCSLEEIPGEFELISLLHVLEHVSDLKSFLEQIKTRLVKNGRLFIEVPFHQDNPFELLIVDHCNHFNVRTLRRAIERHGFHVIRSTSDWVPKELSLLADRGSAVIPLEGTDPGEDVAKLRRAVNWLVDVSAHAKAIAKRGNFGLFGTSIAATWLAYEVASDLNLKVDFFVDEDPRVAGTSYLGKPVYNIDSIPEGANVYLGLAPLTAERVFQRMTAGSAAFQPHKVPEFL